MPEPPMLKLGTCSRLAPAMAGRHRIDMSERVMASSAEALRPEVMDACVLLTLWSSGCAGFYVKAGQALLVLSAMKMETSVSAPVDGWCGLQSSEVHGQRQTKSHLLDYKLNHFARTLAQHVCSASPWPLCDAGEAN